MQIDIKSETIIRLGKVPAWCEENLGNRVHYSTVHRWRTRGANGRKLEWFKVGGVPYTSVEALTRFFCSHAQISEPESNPQNGDSARAREYVTKELGES